jgi:hypothetical protein
MEETEKEAKNKNWQILAGVLAFLFFTGLTVAYFVAHKPFTPTQAVSLGIALGRLLVVLLLVAAAGGLGQRLLPGINLHPLACLALQAALGLCLLALGVLAVGVLGGLRSWIGWLALAALLIWLRRSVAAWLGQWRGLKQAWHQAGRLGKFLAACITLTLFLTLLSSLSPPFHFDTLTYHLVFPRLYLEAGRFYYVPQNMFWGMPQTAEMLYTWAMALAGEPAAATLGWASGVLALAGMLGFGLQKLDTDAAWVAAACLVSGYTLASALSWGYVDWLVMLIGVCWLVMLDVWVNNRQPRYLLLAGVLAGLAFSTKYTAGVLILCGAVAMIYYGWPSFRRILLYIFQYGVAAVLAAAPWLVKNLLATGNPLYPFLFPAGAMTPLRLALYQGGKPFGGWQDIILLPIRATFIGIEGGPGYSASIGPLIFGLSLCAFIGWRLRPAQQKEAIRLAAWVAAAGVITWMVLGRFSSYLLQSRLYFALFPALAFLSSAGFSSLQHLALPHVRLGRIAAFLIALVLGFNAFEVVATTLQQGAPNAILGLKPDADILADNLGWYAPAMQALRQLPPNQRALLLWEPRSLYCLPRCDPDEVLDRWKRERTAVLGAEPGENDAILSNWRAAGYTHLLYYRLGADFIRQEGRLAYTPEDWLAMDALLNNLRLVQDFGSTYALYSLEP